jgi:hypothetical protein
MKLQQAPTWFGIARRVNALLRSPGAKDRFWEQVKEAAAEWQRRPDCRRPLPVPDREVSLAERYAVLAAVWNAYWPGEEKIDPWRKWRHVHLRSMNEEEYRKYKREGLPGLAFHWLVAGVAGDIPTVRLTKKDRVIVADWLADVKADLATGAGTVATRLQRGGRPRKWDDLLALDAEMRNKNPGVKDKDVVDAYNRRYAGPIATGKRHRATSRSLEEARRYRRRVNSETHK